MDSFPQTDYTPMPVPSDEAGPRDEGQTLEEDETYYLADLFIRVSPCRTPCAPFVVLIE